MINLHFHVAAVHIHVPGATAEQLSAIQSQLSQLKGMLMDNAQQMESVLQRIDTATSAVAALLRKFIDEHAAGGMTREQEQSFITRFSNAADALENMAKSAEDPVPQDPPPVE